ncbi:MAG TPA: peptidoglycan bridge formation glycyltransferase FemA/FemB family protein [Candidatus Onthousia excrementipullorum]|uniref:Peptidoglycan bridge formation glycyltransferase FemA/FemB family protein n=1 Tax=Candidatus Onthousia excrementipullorum TaxID=2840884 RepID=A0A9D1J356_9FIRM|nr:peptidoglycan bridge formation glycyltransferase FemA/FemB family protein [Candidatus Onthousia excrementipullorum]
MKIITLDEISFDKFASTHKYRNYYQTSAYAKTIKNHGYDIHYIGIIDDLGNLIGASLLLYKEVFMNYKIAYAPRGFLFDYTNVNNLKELASRLKKLLSKQGFISVTIDPYLPVNIRDKDGKIMNINNEANIALENLKASGFNYLGPNLFFESKKPRFEAIVTLDNDIKDIYQSFEKRVRHKIKKAIRSGVEIYKGSKEELELFYELIKKKYNKPLSYYIDLYNNFENNIDLYFAKLNTETFVITSRLQYEREIEINNDLANKIQATSNANSKKKLINEKMESDKLVNTYKKNLVWATNLLKDNPEGLIIGTSLNLTYDNVCYLIIEGFNQSFKTLNPNYLIKWKMINDYKNKNIKYINLNAVSGEFTKINKYSGLNEMKLGFNSLVTEYIGEFELIISPLPYNLYKNLNKDKDKKK